MDTHPAKPGEKKELSQYQQVSAQLATFAKGIQWPNTFMTPLQKTIANYRLRIDDEINKDFSHQLQNLLDETDKEVEELLRKKKFKIETALRSLQNNDLSNHLY